MLVSTETRGTDFLLQQGFEYVIGNVPVTYSDEGILCINGASCSVPPKNAVYCGDWLVQIMKDPLGVRLTCASQIPFRYSNPEEVEEMLAELAALVR